MRKQLKYTYFGQSFTQDLIIEHILTLSS